MRTATLVRALAFLAVPLLAACITEARDGLTCETDDHCVANGYLCEDGRCSTGSHQPPAALKVTFDTSSGKANTVLHATVTALDKRQPPLQKKSLPDAAVTITCSLGADCPKSATLRQGVSTFEVTFNALGSGVVTATLPGNVPLAGTASLDIAEPTCASGTHWCGTLPCAAGPSAQSCGNGGVCVSCPAPPANAMPATCTSGACDFACNQGYNKCGQPGQQLCTADTNVASCGVACKVCAPNAICYAPAGAATACCTPDCAGKNEGDPAGCGRACPLTPCLYGQRFVAGACACDTTRCLDRY